MNLLYFELELFLPEVHSLKEKRMILNSLKERLSKKFEIIVREKLFFDKWQRTLISCVTLSNEKSFLDKIKNDIIVFIESRYDVNVVNSEFEIIRM